MGMGWRVRGGGLGMGGAVGFHVHAQKPCQASGMHGIAGTCT